MIHGDGNEVDPLDVEDERMSVLAAARAVVVGLDGSEADGPVLDWAADEADRLGSPLRLLHAVDPELQATAYDVLTSTSRNFAEQLEQEAHHLLHAAAARARARHPQLDIATSATADSAAGTLVRLSEQAQRLVIGAPANGRVERVLTGSVALPVVAHAACPVIVVPAGTLVSPPQRIVVGVDGSEHSALAVEFALATAHECGASVECVLVRGPGIGHGGALTQEADDDRSKGQSQGTDLLHRTVDPVAQRFPGVPVSMTVRHGSHAKGLVQAAAGSDADLLVVGSRGRGGFRGLLLGSVSRRVVAHAHCVVAVVRAVHD